MDTEKKRIPWKRFLSTVGGGIVGSVLTLGVVFNTNFVPATPQNTAGVQANNTPSYNIEQTSAKSAPLSLSDMVETASSAIVGVVKYQSSGNRFAQKVEDVESGTGSGVIYKVEGNDAYIVTNNHVIDGAQKIEVSLESGETTTAELIGQDALSDLAVLKIDAKYAKSVLEFGDSDELRAGDPVVAIGNPLGLEFSRTVTQGIVSAVDRTINVETAAGAWELNVIQTDAAINPGNSGGALLNAAGELIGINSLKIAQGGVEGLGFAIPSNEALPLVDEITKNGSVERPYIGVGLANLNEVRAEYVQRLPESVEGGAMIVSVDPESAAGNAGIKESDIITEINGTAVKNSTELRKYLYSELKVGDKASFTIYRGADKITIDLL